MITFESVFFGYTDAATEVERNPSGFQKAFYDPNNYVHELVDGNKFLLRGRKGDGKTAYSEQIKLTEDALNIYAYQKSLSNFNNLVFSQIKTYSNLGGNPYISFWKCILLIECVNMLNTFEPYIESDEYVNILYSLNQYGFLSTDSDISVAIRKLVETNSTITVSSFYKHGRRYERNQELKGAEQIYTSIFKAIKDLYLTKKFIFIIDGLDDVLSSTEYRSDIITGLIRAVEEINRQFRSTTLSIKILILIRDDILSLCRDYNLSKIKRDSSILLKWDIGDDPNTSELLNLVIKRVNENTGEEIAFTQMWYELFPDTIGSRSSLDYVLENIIYRPRDILQLFTEFQKVSIRGKKLSQEKIQEALARYSDEYFLPALQDELTGFFPDEIITCLPQIFSHIGSRYFYLEEFENECSKHKDIEGVSAQTILEHLFKAGYIGQHRPRDAGDYTVFSYRNTYERFQADHECILHRGLMRALVL